MNHSAYRNTLILILVILLALASYSYSRSRIFLAKQTAPSPADITEQANVWKTYNDPSSFISFSYPSSWQSTDSTLSPFTITELGRIEKSISVEFNLAPNGFDSWCKADFNCQSDRRDKANFKQIIFAGKMAYQYSATKDCSNCATPFIVTFLPLPENGTVGVISQNVYPSRPLLTSGNYTFQEKIEALNDPIFEQIFSTIKFTY